jgi:hypothetical protein
MTKKTKEVSIIAIHNEVSRELASKEVMNSLVTTTFKGLSEVSVKQAITEGMMRGFSFKDFLEKNVYAIPFSGGYSLITSIDYARKIGMRSGIVGKSAPKYEFDGHSDNNKISSCTITVKKMINGHVGDFTETVYFDEYYKAGRNGYPSLWDTKPKTMIAKVAEMHALRMACPEELSQAYVEEEMEKEAKKSNEPTEEDLVIALEKLESAKNLAELKSFWADLPIEVKTKLEADKEVLKKKLTPKKKDENKDIQGQGELV